MQREIDAIRARLHWHQGVADIAVAVALAGAALIVAGLRNLPSPFIGGNAGPLTPVSAILILVQTLPLAIRRRYPTPVLMLTGAGIALYS